VPLRADIESGVDIEEEAIKANYVLYQMEQNESGMNLIILDACRDSISESFFEDRKNKGFFDGLHLGLADMRAPTGSLIAYSTAPGTISWTGLRWERNSVYTKHLLKVLQEKAYLSVTDLFIEVRNRVMQETKTERHQQEPWEATSLTQNFCFGQCASRWQPPGISQLLGACKKHFQANRLTSWRGGTALACYEEVLKKAPTNAEALAGLEKIEAKYVRWIQRALNRGQRQKAKRYLASLRKVNPESPKLEKLEEQLQPRHETPIVVPAPIRFLPSNTFVAGKVFRDRLKDGSLAPEMVWIPAGTFRMGDIQGGGKDNEQPVHRVSVNKFAMGRYEVTVGEFRQFVNVTGYKTDAEKGGDCWTYDYDAGEWKELRNANWYNPRFSQTDNHPVVCVSWNDATSYTEWLSTQTRQTYRLPTETEWEYAARAGSNTKYWWGNGIGSNKANCDNNHCGDHFKYTAPVGSFAANVFGLYDTVGNVWEWTCSEYEDSYKGKEKRCFSKKRANSSSLFVLHGGSWIDVAGWTRSSGRYWNSRTLRGRGYGFRPVRIF